MSQTKSSFTPTPYSIRMIGELNTIPLTTTTMENIEMDKSTGLDFK